MAREQVTTVTRRQAGGAHVASAPAAGRVSDPSASARFRRRARKRVTGMARPCAHNAARPHLPPVPVLARRGTPAPATVQPWSRWPGSRSTGGRRGGGMLPAHQLQGELAIPVHTYMQSCPHTHAPGVANIRASSCPKVPCVVIAVAIVVPFLPGFATLGRQRCFRKRPLSNNLSNILYCKKL